MSRILHFSHRVLQVLGFAAIWWAAEVFARWSHLPVPGGVLGLALVLLLLLTGCLPLHHVDLGAQWLLADMLLFFIPAVVAVARYTDLLASSGLKLLLLIAVGNTCVMLVTAMAVETVARRRGRSTGEQV